MKRLTYLLLCLLMPAMAAAENAPVKYTDAASLTIVNKAQPGGPGVRRRPFPDGSPRCRA